MLTGIIVENYRVFEKEVEFEIKPLTIFTGPNNSGKSSVLNVIDILSYIFKDSDNLVKLVKQGIPENIFVEKYGGFENLFTQNSIKESIKFGFLHINKQLRCELRYTFEFNKSGKLIKYRCDEKRDNCYENIIKCFFETKTPESKDTVKVNFIRLNQLVSEIAHRTSLYFDACISIRKKIQEKYADLSNENDNYDKYHELAEGKYKQLIEARGKLKFVFVTDKNQIKIEKNTIHIVSEFHRITKKEFNSYFQNINETYTINDLMDGIFLSRENIIIEHLSRYQKCKNIFIDEHGRPHSILDNVLHQIGIELDKIYVNLKEFLETEIKTFDEEYIQPIIEEYKLNHSIEIEVIPIDTQYELLEFEAKDGLFEFSYFDELENKHISINDAEAKDLLWDDPISEDAYKEEIIGLEIFKIPIDDDKDRFNYLNSILKRYYPEKYNESEYLGNILLSNILLDIFTKVNFEPDWYRFKYYPGLFSSLRQSGNIFEDVINLNLGSIYNISEFLIDCNINEFVQYIKRINLNKSKKILDNNLLLKYSDLLLNHNLKDQLPQKDKIFLLEIFVYLVKINLSEATLNKTDRGDLIKGIIRELDAYTNSEFSNKFSDYSGRRFKVISEFLKNSCLDFPWIQSELQKFHINHNSNTNYVRSNNFLMENEISQLIKKYAFIRDNDMRHEKYTENETEKESIKNNLKRYVIDFGLADDIEIEILKNTNAFNIYMISNGQKTLLQDNGYGTIQLFSVLLYFSINKRYDDELNNQTYIIKEPERNLHPALQSKLGQEFSIYVSPQIWNNNRRILAETHSEYLIRKIQTIVAKKELKKEDVIIYYIHKNRGSNNKYATVKKITLNDRGVMSEAFGSGFFDESDTIVNELLEIRLNQTN